MRLISKNSSKANGNFLEVLELSYKTHYNLLFNYGLKFINDPALIEDLIQDIFVKLCKRGNADDINDLKVYLLRAFGMRSTTIMPLSMTVCISTISSFLFQTTKIPSVISSAVTMRKSTSTILC